jgi:hypothetical protein
MKSAQNADAEFCLQPSNPEACNNCRSFDQQTTAECRKLSLSSFSAAFVHFLQSIAMIILIYTKKNFGNYAVVLTMSSIVKNDGGGAMLTTERNQLVTVYIAWLCVGFFLISAISQLAQGMNGFEEVIKMRVNFIRWIEYSVSSSIMICIILCFVGIRDVVAVVGIFSLNLTMNALGCLMELSNSIAPQGKSIMWFPFLLGCWTSLVPWTCIIFALCYGGRAPDFVYALFAGYFVLHFFSPINMAWRFLQTTHSAEDGIVLSERNYII